MIDQNTTANHNKNKLNGFLFKYLHIQINIFLMLYN